jgi:hypothetical protein
MVADDNQLGDRVIFTLSLKSRSPKRFVCKSIQKSRSGNRKSIRPEICGSYFSDGSKARFHFRWGRSKGIWEQSASNCKPKFDLKKGEAILEYKKQRNHFLNSRGLVKSNERLSITD